MEPAAIASSAPPAHDFFPVTRLATFQVDRLVANLLSPGCWVSSRSPQRNQQPSKQSQNISGSPTPLLQSELRGSCQCLLPRRIWADAFLRASQKKASAQMR